MSMEKFSFLSSLDGTLLYEEPLAGHTSFKIGGNAEAFFTPRTEEALSEAVRFARENDIPCRILGNGTNLLVRDEGVRGLVIALSGGLTELSETGDGEIYCSAGVSLKRLCTFALERSLTGLEFAYGIPGSVGGAIYMNAGAYGGEIKNVLVSARVLDPKSGSIETLAAAGLDISYRHTPFMTNGLVILGGTFRLEKGDEELIRARMNELMGKRKASQPLTYPSAGSTFKRPKTGYAAALIDECGLKGFSVGDAEVSTKHAGFVINKGSASFDDVMRVIANVRETVLEKKHTYLRTEVEIW